MKVRQGVGSIHVIFLRALHIEPRAETRGFRATVALRSSDVTKQSGSLWRVVVCHYSAYGIRHEEIMFFL